MTRPQAATSPSAPRANPPPLPGAPAKVQTPRAPAVAPAPSPSPRAPAGATGQPSGAGRWDDEPPSGGWEAADDTVASFLEHTELPAPPPRHLPATATTASAALEKAAVPVAAAPAKAAPATPASPVGASAPGTMRARYETSPGVGGPPVALPAAGARGITAPSAASQASLGTAMREEVWSIVRAAVEEAMGPLVARQRELEARVERAERENDAERTRAARVQNAPSTAPQGGGSAVPKLAPMGSPVSSIPVTLGPSLSPPVLNIPGSAAVPDFKLSAPESPSRDAGDERARAKTSAHPVGPRPSIPVNGYGVTVMTVPRATLDLDSVGPVDIDGFDGGKSKKRVATFVVVIMLLLIVGAVTMTILSHN